MPNRRKLIIGLFTSQESRFSQVKQLLEKKYGSIDLVSPVMDFTHTKYYEQEFGSNLKRIFFSFERLINTEAMYKLKLYTGNIEKRLMHRSKRQVNIDPGYVSLAKLILLTTKDYSHRIYLKKDIYAEVTLKFEGNSFIPWPWTYPDYRTNEYIKFFNKVRQIYKAQV